MPAQRRTPGQLVSVGGVAAWLGVEPSTVSTWIPRYAGTPTPTPAPDFEILPGRHDTPDVAWLDTDERRAEWEAWRASRPGQGAKGRPKPRKEKATEDASTSA